MLRRIRFGVLAAFFGLGFLFGAAAPTVRAAANWYVAPGGNDSDACSSAVTACATINGASNKGGFTAGDTVLVASGTYTGAGSQVVLLDKNVTLSGGWNADFSIQNGTTTLDGQDAGRVLDVLSGITATLTRFQIINGFPGDNEQGAGIRNAGTLTVNHSNIENNRTHGSSAAGIANTGTLILNNTTVRANHAQDYGYIVSGGGIANNGTLTVNNSAVMDNIAAFGAGISQNGGTLILNNVTVARNTSNGGINAAGLVSYGGATQLNNVTITENFGNAGIGLVAGSITLRNTILAGNNPDGSGADCGGAIPGGAITSQGYNLIGAGCNFALTTGDQATTDPKLGISIGASGYYPLLPNSPARDAGNPTGCQGSSGILTTDQRGVARNGTCDIGAYEYTAPGAPESILVVSGASQRSPRNVTFWNSLQTIVLDADGSPIPNASVTFTAPANGAGGTFADTHTNSTDANSDARGVAQAPSFQANNTEGSYVVEAVVNGVGAPASFDLSNFGWYISDTGNDANNCQSPATACQTVGGTLTHAGFQERDTILVAAGTYIGTGNEVLLLEQSARLLGGWDANFSTQNGMTTLDGQQARRVVLVDDSVVAHLDHFNIKNGYIACCTTVTGGGIHNKGTLTLDQSIVQDNESASYNAGGIFNRGVLNVNDSEISTNTASGGSGGGIENSGGRVRIWRSTIQNNTSVSGGGGGIDNSGGTLTLDASTVNGNTGAAGAGISNNGSATITNSAIINNIAPSSGDGGGISGSAFLKITNSTLSGNQAGFGGGIMHVGGTLILESVSIVGNTALNIGGGLRAPSGTVTLHNTMLAANSAPQDPDCYGVFTSNDYNFIAQQTANCAFTPGTGDIVNINAFVDSLENNGGPTKTVRIRSASPAVDNGDAGSCLAQDQRGVARPQGAGCDIGAFELDAAPAADLVLQQSDVPDPVGFGDVLTYTLSIYNNGPQTAPDVQLDSVLPAKTTFKELTKSAGWNCTQPPVGTNGAIHCTLASLANGASANLALQVLVTPSKKKRADLLNYAALSSGVYDAGGDPLILNEPTCVGVPMKSKLIAPTKGGVVKTTSVTFDWSDAHCAESYRLSVRKGSLTGTEVLRKKNLPTSTFTTIKPLPKATYYWQVSACNAFGCQLSKWFRFQKK